MNARVTCDAALVRVASEMSQVWQTVVEDHKVVQRGRKWTRKHFNFDVLTLLAINQYTQTVKIVSLNPRND